MKKKLLVIVPDRLSVIINKGEVIPRYYNPGDLFDEVYIMMTNDDRPDPNLVQTMIGNAKLKLLNFPPPPHFFRKTLGWQFCLMKSWSESFLKLVSEISPQLIRTHNNFLEGYLASIAKKKSNIPFVTSLHGIWDIDDLTTLKSKVHRLFRKKIERMTLENAAKVICVYSPIKEYAERYGALHAETIPNFVGESYLKQKKDWTLGSPLKFITINRQLPEKDPTNILKALLRIPHPFEYNLIGDGVLHDSLKEIARDFPSHQKVNFIKGISNEKVCDLLASSDFIVSNCKYKGISKTIIEAGLTGLPIILNRYDDAYQLTEYGGGWVHLCNDSPEGYEKAIRSLIDSDTERENLGRNALSVTKSRFCPRAIEAKVVNIYKGLV